MGEVYLAQDTSLDRKVAIKILPADVASNNDRMERFVREAKSAAALNHPNIAQVFEIGEHEGTHFIAMEFIDGVTLREKIHLNRSDLRKLLKNLQQVAEGLSKAHSAGIVHRDLKPDNIMITRDGFAKVLDFGLAKLIEKRGPAAGESEDSNAPTNLMGPHSAPGVVMGTVGYMSPEQAMGKTTEIDQRSDIFSFGCILFETVTGRKPFEGDSVIKTLHSLIYEPASLIRELNPSAPAELQRIVGRCLEKDPDERYQTIKDVAIELKNLRRGMSDAIEGAASTTRASENISPNTSSDSSLGTPHGNASTTNVSSVEYLITGIKRHKLATLLSIIVIGAAIGGFAIYSRGANAESRIESIAVMPFVNESGNADVEYLSDGMTETLISSLSQLPKLNVKPRSSVFRYKGKETNPQTIGKELNVQAILNGRFVQRGTELSLFVELIDIASDKVVWSETYNRKQSDLVTLQSDIARDVSGKIKTKLSGADQAKVTKTYTTNPAAYQLYLKGNFYQAKYTEEGYSKAIECYQKAIDIDPNYALPYHGIAMAYDFANGWYLSPKESEPKAKAAALKALELDDTLAETHYLLSKILFWYDWDYPAAERESKRANELDQTYPAEYPVYLAAIGRFDDAINAQETVLKRSPLDLNANLDQAGILLSAGRYEQSIAQTKKALELDPNFWWSYQNLGLVYERKKQYTEAIGALEIAFKGDSNPSSLGYLGNVYAAAGKPVEAQNVVAQLRELSKTRYVSAYYFACVYAGLNDKDQAFEWFERAYQERCSFMTLLKFETVLDNLHADPRFKELLKRMNLPE